MPDHNTLKPGDTIRIIAVSKADFEQREREGKQGVEQAGWTANCLEKVIKNNPVVTIDFIDSYGKAWFSCDLEDDEGDLSEHSFVILDDDSWEYI